MRILRTIDSLASERLLFVFLALDVGTVSHDRVVLGRL